MGDTNEVSNLSGEKDYYGALDGLRSYAVVCIVMYHVLACCHM